MAIRRVVECFNIVFFGKLKYVSDVSRWVLVFFMGGLAWMLACKSKPSVQPPKPLTKVEAAAKALVDLNATQNQLMEDLIAMRGRLLSMPKDSPPTRNLTRQLAILNKRATDIATDIFRAEMALDNARREEAAAQAAADANATDSNATVPALPGGDINATQPFASVDSLNLFPFTLVKDGNSTLRHVVGRVDNNGTQVVTDVSVVFNLFDDNNATVGTATDSITSIAAGSVWNYKAPVTDANVTRVEFGQLDFNGTAGAIPPLPAGNN